MTRRTWHAGAGARRGGREATLADVIETVERTAPETKGELADRLDLSEHYLSDLLRELKSAGVVSKAYVVDRDAVYETADELSALHAGDAPAELREGLRRLDEVTVEQYAAARAALVDEPADLAAEELESLANERCLTVLSELKSFTLTTDWPGNRAAADLAAVAIDMELVGDHACFVSETVANGGIDSAGAVTDRLLDVFDAGLSINDHLGAVLFDCALDRIDALYAEEERVHRELDELFELVTTYDPRTFGDLAAVSRSLERAIYYWVDAAERLVGLLSGVEPDHLGR